jgi:hypothetical protein
VASLLSAIWLVPPFEIGAPTIQKGFSFADSL